MAFRQKRRIGIGIAIVAVLAAVAWALLRDDAAHDRLTFVPDIDGPSSVTAAPAASRASPRVSRIRTTPFRDPSATQPDTRTRPQGPMTVSGRLVAGDGTPVADAW